MTYQISGVRIMRKFASMREFKREVPLTNAEARLFVIIMARICIYFKCGSTYSEKNSCKLWLKCDYKIKIKNNNKTYE